MAPRLHAIWGSVSANLRDMPPFRKSGSDGTPVWSIFALTTELEHLGAANDGETAESPRRRMVALWVGVILAVAVGMFGTVVGLDRERGFYPTVMIVIALLYVLYAVMGGSTNALLLESLVAGLFVIAAVAGFRSSLWIVVVALAAHGVFDLAHGGIIANPGVPAFWRDFCLTYDVVAAGYLAWILKSRRVPASA